MVRGSVKIGIVYTIMKNRGIIEEIVGMEQPEVTPANRLVTLRKKSERCWESCRKSFFADVVIIDVYEAGSYDFCKS